MTEPIELKQGDRIKLNGVVYTILEDVRAFKPGRKETQKKYPNMRTVDFNVEITDSL